ncbi:SRPBCC family protein [Pontixanthobacter aestiaquae]|uniref:SRPBCC family protein n=1 Tax=Pontixanthobacter aestiaquae TaxID=1509367 RepID=A0A844ZB24_9SPHN|nr:SRPBCC family protein [Pontixanthobacter aestiaquae]MDN3644909.1 SRPBCC family protein [Pontixanthobacter aestiaquae]MXO84090.1 SRPBCC family protein [Pontixanthobacter aestiaquae]
MATIWREQEMHCNAREAWDAIADVSALHVRVAPGLVKDTQYDPKTKIRIVTFEDGNVLKEQMVGSDPDNMRIAWTASSEDWEHHNAGLQVHDMGNGHCKVRWTADFWPDSVAEGFGPMMEAGLAAMKGVVE